MATAKDHFALDWIKTDLLETLSEARAALDDYAEREDETRLRTCLTCLHQVHGTLVMLELKGVTLLADHLERLAQAMMSGHIGNRSAASQTLMQGILELPGHLEELQRGADDEVDGFISLVNEARGLLNLESLVDRAGGSLLDAPDEAVIERFERIDGVAKVAKIRSAYQNVLLSILKGEDRAHAVDVLKKIAASLERVSEGSALARQWQAFGEFVVSLTYSQGALESEAVKLLRRVDLEIKNLVKKGAASLRRPVNVELVQQLLNAAVERDHTSAELEGLQQAVTRDLKNNGLAISGRQAMASAAVALKEELALIKNKLDLNVRGDAVDLDELRQLIAPLKRVGSTLSLLGFESSRAIVVDQIEAIESLVVLGDTDPQAVQSMAGALMQIDENLSSVAQGSEQSEVEQITSEAQRQLLREARKGLDLVKQNVVDFVSTHWDVRHLQQAPATIAEICGALEIVPLSRPVGMLTAINAYMSGKLMQGHRPEWMELDLFADVVSAIDYYLERLVEDNPAGADDILIVAERSLNQLQAVTGDAAQALTPDADAKTARVADADVPALVVEDVAQIEDALAELFEEPTAEPAGETATAAAESTDAAHDDEPIDTATIVEQDDPELELESDSSFDLGGDVFDGIDGAVETVDALVSEHAGADEPADEPLQAAAGQEPEMPVESAQTAAVEEDVAPAEPVDPEIVEIFVEEVDEVLETIDEFLPQWAQTLTEGDPLTEIRRSFHTLKGSGRIVKAFAIGELSWAIENMLNRVIDGTVVPTGEFAHIAREAREKVPELRDAFAAGRDLGVDSVAHLIEQADLLASGGALEAARSHAVEDVDPAAAARQVPEATPVDDPARVGDEADDAWLEEQWAADAAANLPDPVFVLFLEEAQEHLSAIEAENAADPWQLSQDLGRAFHTLAGTAAMAGVESVKLIVEPADQVVEAYRNDAPTPALEEFFSVAATHLRECFAALERGEEWDEPLEFVALADDLIARRMTSKRPLDDLLEAAAVTALFAGETVLADLLDGNADEKGDFIAALGEISVLGVAAQTDDIADLALAFSTALRTVEQGEAVNDAARAVCMDAYEELLDHFNALAAGGHAEPNPALLQSLRTLQIYDPKQADTPAVAATETAGAPVPESTADTGAMEPDFDPSDIDADLVDVFFEEAEEIAEAIEETIVRWSDERENRIHIENLLRGLHTLKGGARLCGLSKLGDMAHDFESLVVAVQNSERSVDAPMFAEMNQRYDELIGFIGGAKAQIQGNAERDEALAAAREMPPIEEDVPVRRVEKPVETPPRAKVIGLKPAAAGHDAEVSGVNAVIEEFVGQQRDPERPQLVQEELPEEPKRVQQEMVRVGSALLEELVNLAGENSILRARIEQGMSDFTVSLDEMETTIERLREQLRRLEIETETQILFRHDRTDGPAYENFDPLEMDRYSQLQQLSRGLSESASDMLDLKETLLFKARESETLLLQQARINTELQEGLMRTRMVPFSRLLPRLRRIVRQVAGELDKEIDFHVQNAEGELDRNLLERMVPPLEHMLRNAVDHGIESADLRRNFGKSPTGRIDLRLTREGGDVVLEISDDGAGVDVESVRAKAIERGLMARDASMTDEEVTQFILAAGFSTAKSVTQISGRGVGMDVVHSEVKQLGGSISIVSRPGKGSRFVVRVPFTVSVNRALMVSVGDDLYALPLNTIEGIVLLNPEQLKALYASETKTFEYAGIPYRIRYLGQYLGREFHGPSGQSSVPVVLVRSGDYAVAIHVDAVQGSREIVVKSLGPQFAGVGGISGATILGDGSVVVILDLLALIRAQQTQRSGSKQRGLAQPRRPRCVMVVDDSVTVRKVTSRLLERQGMDVLVAKDGIEAVALLQERLPDVMLLDIEMPRMDGFEVARQVRHDDRMGGLPIIMISSRTGDKHKEHASELGVNKFLGKPFQENELLATIDELVTR